VRRAGLALAVALLAAAMLPSTASAHVGRVAPAATNYLARISHLPAGLEARVVDGDQAMWLRVSPALNVVVLGLRGEQYLRFTSAGVAVNTRSATWFLNRLRPQVVPHGLTSRTPPRWQTLTARHWWTWHEDRMHALVLAAHPSGNTYLGRWTVPLVIDGRRTAIRGGLWQSAPASLLWFWPLLLAVVCFPALLKLREARLEAPVGAGLAFLALVASTVARLGRELYGRPSVSSWQLVLVAVTCLVAVALAVVFNRREWRMIGGLAIGIAAAYQGLALVSTLRDGWVLAAIPSWLERTSTAVSLASGVALVVVSITVGASDRETEDESDSDRRAELLVHR
jgi:hypothetical protein